MFENTNLIQSSEQKLANEGNETNKVDKKIKFSSSQKQKRVKLSEISDTIKELKNLNENINQSSTDTEFDVFGRHVSAQLEKLSTENALLAQEKIQQVLTHYRLIELKNQTFQNPSMPTSIENSTQHYSSNYESTDILTQAVASLSDDFNVY